MTTNVALRCGLCGGPCSSGNGVCFACDYPDEWDDGEIVKLTEEPPVPLCVCCHAVVVEMDRGFDTCPDCMARV